nr:immunoglobulin heavy chain junction region [Mus musculus]
CARNYGSSPFDYW